MTLRTRYIQQDLKLSLSVSCRDIGNPSEIEETFHHLEAAIDEISARLEERDIYFFQISLSVPGLPSAAGAYDPYDGLDYCLTQSNPWTGFCPAFWDAARSDLQLRQRTKAYLVKLEELLMRAAALSRPTLSLWEDDEAQLGEPLAAHLALSDLEFVPYYTQLLRLWDPENEVEAGNEVVAIVKKWGMCPETRDLIGCFSLELDGARDIQYILREMQRFF
ncbi:hypothetical protein [Marinibacterium profundimaris]|uniref:Uncharacterized protein n=1 Tax=Marinibacterium profundimaris TaxID=1679460 RepID=A0A225NJ62_9RHOB|nr:hypothetical protein [Marinibacterium profundimaris]OWU68719.1 hypothetical protein ATO3_23520 [Marinibacterium profundimaris]